MLDVDRRNHPAAPDEALAVLSLDADAAPTVEHQARDEPVAEHGAAVIRDEANQGFRELTGPSTGNRPAATLAPEHDRVGERTRAGGVHRDQRLERLPEHERAQVLALVLVPDHVPGA